MKKNFIASLIIGLAMVGCVKERSCTTTTTHTNGDVDTDITHYDKLSRGEMREIVHLGSYTTGNGTVHHTECK